LGSVRKNWNSHVECGALGSAELAEVNRAAAAIFHGVYRAGARNQSHFLAAGEALGNWPREMDRANGNFSHRPLAPDQ